MFSRYSFLFMLVANSFALDNERSEIFDEQHFTFHLERLREVDDNTFYKVGENGFSHADRAYEIEEYFKENFELEIVSNNLENLSVESIKVIFSAIELTSYYLPRPRYTAYLQEIINILQEKGMSTDRYHRSLLESFISIRDFDSAIKLIEDNKNLSHDITYLHISNTLVPEFENIKTFWQFSTTGSDKTALSKQNLVKKDLNKLIVVVSNPSCHFSRSAMADIFSSDIIDARRFGESSLWLMPPGSGISLGRVKDSQNISMYLQLGLLHNWSDWPEIVKRGTPTFYFFSEGSLVDILIGWRGASSMDQLQSILQAHGFTVLNSTLNE